jgi:hypothetical protein
MQKAYLMLLALCTVLSAMGACLYQWAPTLAVLSGFALAGALFELVRTISRAG